MNHLKKIALITILSTALASTFQNCTSSHSSSVASPLATDGNITFSATQFEESSTDISNPIINLTPGMIFSYETMNEDSSTTETIVVVRDTIKVIAGVETLEVRTRKLKSGQLIEEIIEYFAQDKEGNIWVFAHNQATYDSNGNLNRSSGWSADDENTKPILWVKSKLVIGEFYDLAPRTGIHSQRAQVVTTSATIQIGEDTFTNCTQIRITDDQSNSSGQLNSYCPEIFGLALTEDIATKSKTVLTSKFSE